MAVDSLGMPVVKGLGLSDAVQIMEKAGYAVRTVGLGRVYDQKIVVDSTTMRRTAVLTLSVN